MSPGAGGAVAAKLKNAGTSSSAEARSDKPAANSEIKLEASAEESNADSPTLSHEQICEALTEAAARHDLPLLFFARLIWQESRFNPRAVSPAGAQGVAQFMPKVAAEMGLADPFDPVQALPMSARLLSQLQERFGNLGLAAAAYNGGARRIREWLDNKGKLPKETRDYVVKITGVAAERWRNPGPQSIEFKLPPRLPCENLPATELHATAVPLPPQRPLTLLAANEEKAEEPTTAGSDTDEESSPPQVSARSRRPGRSARSKGATRSAAEPAAAKPAAVKRPVFKPAVAKQPPTKSATAKAMRPAATKPVSTKPVSKPAADKPAKRAAGKPAPDKTPQTKAKPKPEQSARRAPVGGPGAGRARTATPAPAKAGKTQAAHPERKARPPQRRG